MLPAPSHVSAAPSANSKQSLCHPSSCEINQRLEFQRRGEMATQHVKHGPNHNKPSYLSDSSALHRGKYMFLR
jgi:hypothetical protein